MSEDDTPGTFGLLTHRPSGRCNTCVGTSLIRSLLILAAFAPFAHAGNEEWSGWRGPRHDGTSLESGFPTRWSATENVVWKVAIPGKGHSSPVVWGDRLFRSPLSSMQVVRNRRSEADLLRPEGRQDALGARRRHGPPGAEARPQQLREFNARHRRQTRLGRLPRGVSVPDLLLRPGRHPRLEEVARRIPLGARLLQFADPL